MKMAFFWEICCITNRGGLCVPFLAGIANSLFDLIFVNMLTLIIWVFHQTRGRFQNIFKLMTKIHSKDKLKKSTHLMTPNTC